MLDLSCLCQYVLINVYHFGIHARLQVQDSVWTYANQTSVSLTEVYICIVNMITILHERKFNIKSNPQTMKERLCVY